MGKFENIDRDIVVLVCARCRFSNKAESTWTYFIIILVRFLRAYLEQSHSIPSDRSNFKRFYIRKPPLHWSWQLNSYPRWPDPRLFCRALPGRQMGSQTYPVSGISCFDNLIYHYECHLQYTGDSEPFTYKSSIFGPVLSCKFLSEFWTKYDNIHYTGWAIPH